MKILYLNFDILSERCNDRDNLKEQRSCFSIVVSSQKKGWLKWRKTKWKMLIYINFYCLLAYSSKMRNFK